MKKLFLVFSLSILSYLQSYSQAENEKAIVAYNMAQEAYEKEDFTTAEKHLKKTIEYLGSTNSKIQFLYTKVLMKLERWKDARKEADLYFKLEQKPNKDENRHAEMVQMAVYIDQGIDKYNLDQKLNPIRDSVSALVKAIDSLRQAILDPTLASTKMRDLKKSLEVHDVSALHSNNMIMAIGDTLFIQKRIDDKELLTFKVGYTDVKSLKINVAESKAKNAITKKYPWEACVVIDAKLISTTTSIWNQDNDDFDDTQSGPYGGDGLPLSFCLFLDQTNLVKTNKDIQMIQDLIFRFKKVKEQN